MGFKQATAAKATSLLGDRRLGQLQAYRRNRELRHFSPRRVEHTYGERKLKVWLTDPISAGWYDREAEGGLFEIDLLATSKLATGATVFDLGAHQCLIAMILAHRVGPTGRVVAVEANAHNCETAQLNLRDNEITNVDVLCAAVGPERGETTFTCDFNGKVDDGRGLRGTVTVPMTTVDDLVVSHGPPDVVFVDVEGFECQVLAGARATLGRCRPDFFVEVHLGGELQSFGGSVQELLAHFDEQYRLFVSYGENEPFAPLRRDETFPADRFFLVALA